MKNRKKNDGGKWQHHDMGEGGVELQPFPSCPLLTYKYNHTYIIYIAFKNGKMKKIGQNMEMGHIWGRTHDLWEAN